MKKLSLVLALAMLASMMITGCAKTVEPGDTTTEGTTTQAVTTTQATTTAADTTAAPDPTEPQPTAPQYPPMADASKFTVDGDLSEWTKDIHTIGVYGEPDADDTTTFRNSGNKNVTFWCAMTDDGLYLAAEAFHDEYSVNAKDWWMNTNFEFFITDGSHQYFVYAGAEGALKSDNVTEAVMKTEEIDSDTKYHSVVECFVEAGYLFDIYHNTVTIGTAWKTVGDCIIGGFYTFNADRSDEYWGPLGGAVNSAHFIASPIGLYDPDDYPFE